MKTRINPVKPLLAVIICLTLIAGMTTLVMGAEMTHASSNIFVGDIKADIDGYNIEGNNYFKLRDLAKALSGSEKNFQVIWDEKSRSVILKPGIDYFPDGTEGETSTASESVKAVKTTTTVFLGQKEVSLDAYNVNGYNYVKLRDVAALIDFALIYYDETHSVYFKTDSVYKDSQEIYSDKKEESGESAVTDTTKDINGGWYQTRAINQYSKYLTNFADGYKIMVPIGAEIDGTWGEIRTVAETSNLRLEIYRQKLASSYSSYVNYGNKFISDTKTYTKIYSGNMTFAGKSAYVLEWKRAPLSKVKNDRCYYACVDLKISNYEVMTFFFKSSVPFNNGGSKSYVDIMNTLSLQNQSVTVKNTKTKSTINPFWNEETKAFYEENFGSAASLKWGIFQPDAPHWSMDKLRSIESQINYKFKYLLCYTDIKTSIDYIKSILEKAAADNRTLELTFQTTSVSSGNMIYDILNGKYDDHLNQYAKAIAMSGKPVLFRLCNEMNGDWCPYSAYNTGKDTEIYVELYKYFYSIFEKNGALANTIWVFNPNHKSFPDYYWNHALSYYPGDEYVDVIGLTAYNTGTYYPGEKWSSFASLYDAFYYAYVAWFSQPMMITEFSCSSYGGDKVAWTEEMFKKIGSYNRIKVAVWWNGADFDTAGRTARPYYITDPQGVLGIFKKHIGEQNG